MLIAINFFQQIAIKNRLASANLTASIKNVKCPPPSVESVSFKTTKELPHTMVTNTNSNFESVALLNLFCIFHHLIVIVLLYENKANSTAIRHFEQFK